MFSCSTCVKWTFRVLALALAGTAACSPTGIFGNNTTLGGTIAGGRGTVQVIFINNTPFRVIFTYGLYDPQDKDIGPVFGQFFASSTASLRLEGNSDSGVITQMTGPSGTVTSPCCRMFSIGGDELIDRIKAAHLDVGASAEALNPGIAFSDKPLDDPAAGQPTAGLAPPVLTNQGSQFPCDGLLIYTFTPDSTQSSGVRVDLQGIPP